MWPIRNKDTPLPKSFYQKARELERQAKEEPNADVRKIQLEAADRYYRRDAESGEPILQTVLLLLLSYLAVAAVAIYTFRSFPPLWALVIVGASYVTMAFLTGASLRAAGYISENSLMGIFRAGLRLLSLRGNPPAGRR